VHLEKTGLILLGHVDVIVGKDSGFYQEFMFCIWPPTSRSQSVPVSLCLVRRSSRKIAENGY